MNGRGQSPGLGFGPSHTAPIVKQLLIANGVAFVLQFLVPGFDRLAAIYPAAVWQGGYVWQPFTYMWLHGSPGHLLMNLFVLWMFGSPLAMAWGAKRFLRFYLICGIGAGFIIATVPYLTVAIGLSPAHTLRYATVGASGAIYGVLLAYSFTWPDRTIMLIFPPVAFRAIWLIPAMFFMTVAFGGGNISHVGHLGGVVVAWLYMRRTGDTRGFFSIAQLKLRWRRYRMRQKLRSIQYEEFERRRDDDRRMH